MRTSTDAVEAILGDDYGAKVDGTFPDLEPYIEAASAIIDDVAACAIAKDKTLSSTRLELLERWLSAHFYVMSDQPYTEKETGQSRGVFQGKTGMYLEASKYGQMAVTMDSSGCLFAIASGERKKVTMFWMGLRPSEQTDYEDRD